MVVINFLITHKYRMKNMKKNLINIYIINLNGVNND